MTLAFASDVLLRLVAETDTSVRLEEVRYGKRPKTWRVVQRDNLQAHIDEWMTQKGLTYDEAQPEA